MTPIKDLEITDVHILSEPHEGFIISWTANIGFGEVCFYKKDGKWYADTECMSKDFCKLLLDLFFDFCKRYMQLEKEDSGFDKFLESVEIEK